MTEQKNGMAKQLERGIKRLKRKIWILRIKWVLLFVLPILAVYLAYETVKQFLKLKIRQIAAAKTTEKPEES